MIEKEQGCVFLQNLTEHSTKEGDKKDDGKD